MVAKKSSVLVLGHFTFLILSTAKLNVNYKNVFQALGKWLVVSAR